MKLDLSVPENWEQLNDSLKKILAIHAPQQLRVFKDLSSAVLEIAQGTAQFLSHKKSVGFLKGQSPAFDFLLPHFYKEAYQIINTSYLQIENVKAWVEALNKDTNFVIFAEDQPVTGEIYTFCDELDQALNEKKIFSLRISHARHQQDFVASTTTKQTEVRPYSVRICSFAENLAIAILGERFRSPPMIARRQPWHLHETLDLLKRSLKPMALQTDSQTQEQTQEQILAFEMELASHLQIWFQKGVPRLWDRSVVVFPDISGEALVTKIFAHWGVVAERGCELIETTNMCRWNSIGMFQSWWEPLPSAETLRGMVVFSLEALRTKDFAKLVLSSYEEIKQMQSWS